MEDAVTSAPRERGWRRLVLALLFAFFLPLVPWLRPLVPVERIVVLLVPAIAACTVVGWWRGGRLIAALAWSVLAAWMVATLVRSPGATSFDRLSAGWALLLAALFGIVSVVVAARPFLERALAATGLALAGTILVLALGSGTAERTRAVVLAELERRAEMSLAQWDANAATPEWQKLFGSAELKEAEGQVRERIATLPAVGIAVFPALLAVESLLVLALAWSLYHRLSRARIGPPLARLREFRFNDQLVWGLVVGVTLLLLPALAELRAAGINLIVFFGALYLLRGFGVLTWFLAPRGLAMALLVGVALLAPPLVGAAALWFGLGDTWFDWRSRPRSTT